MSAPEPGPSPREAETEDLSKLLGPGWESLLAQGGETLAPELSLRGLAERPERTLNWEPLRLEGPQAEFERRALLGSGGMGEVSMAFDRVLQREVALKQVRSDKGSEGSRALVDEALLTSGLDHPNVIPVHRLGTDAEGQPVLVMKRVRGSSWHELIADPGHFTWEALPGDRLRANLEVFDRVCRAAHHAHERGILHRDIKPPNVMVSDEGEVYLVDWGLALRLAEREATPQELVGTLAFMAPEMLEHPRNLSPQTDVYLLGATLHFVLTGAPRHCGESNYNVMLQALRSAPYAYGPEVPAPLAALLNRATARDPAERFASAEALRLEVGRFLERRGSLELTGRAEEELRSLEALPLPGEPGAREGDDEAAAARLAAARFGFEQALATWPENPPARAGLQRALVRALERALAARSHGHAAALLASLPEPRPDLAAAVAQLAEERVQEADARQRLEALERDLDPRLAGREKARVVIVLGALSYGGLLALTALLLSGLFRFGPGVAALFGGVAGLSAALGVYLGRSFFFSNRPNRTLVRLGVAGWVSLMLSVACYGAYFPGNGDLFILYVGVLLSASLFHMAAAVDWRLVVPATIAALGCLSGVLFPGVDPMLVHILAGSTCLGSVGLLWWRDPPGA